ncbi:hypothetical protein ACFU8T_07280 [Sphingobacterium spiritivorum]|uniref:Uncharacterized protein n=1 Tax=Sphingobacterium spiritivorum ATCC 33861 TaxID=525373 RepID=D7VS08_SPHSI|nr:hypothetical protein [Sphingobacterium spiritivorum]EFK56559.1 hypothetical protein HMPREF0766_13762 [Sphingobacterium spiritivorum ATCC 33861]QQT35381.1 hypothetical protein I6J01_19210 [Sphingobacterium spiritivorum]WQD32067.1 hypothetical protein U0038_11160 [Sphingobacterium spiritivorum]SUJ05481.1 Uncharacterised protein [Sphingobacterium spiritivorum]
MPKIRCVCDYIINLSEIPSANQYLMISDVSFEKYFDEEVNAEDLYSKMIIVAHCSNCGRLHVFYDGFDKDQVIYRVDN